jgi:hypothetical protein
VGRKVLPHTVTSQLSTLFTTVTSVTGYACEKRGCLDNQNKTISHYVALLDGDSYFIRPFVGTPRAIRPGQGQGQSPFAGCDKHAVAEGSQAGDGDGAVSESHSAPRMECVTRSLFQRTQMKFRERLRERRSQSLHGSHDVRHPPHLY